MVHDKKKIATILKLERFYALVDGSFFPEDFEWISEFWIFAMNKNIISR